MLDFLTIEYKERKDGTVEVFPKFRKRKSKDLMIRGSAFYAIWDEAAGFWTTDEYRAIEIIDNEIFALADNMIRAGSKIVHTLSEYSVTGANPADTFYKYCKSCSDNYHELDSRVRFLGEGTRKSDYTSHTLPYKLEKGRFDAFEELIGTLYNPEEKLKLEWAIGAIVAGRSSYIQKFLVLYGPPGSGKSTFLKIVRNMFDGYITTIDSEALGSRGNQFALDAFSNNPLIGIEDDGDLSRIDKNTNINSIVSHETMKVNEKFKKPYDMTIRTFMMIGTNKPVKITDAKSGLLRRLIDVYPSGNKLPHSKYDSLMEQIKFEHGAIAAHCLEIYEKLGEFYYDGYRPIRMMSETNDLYNFVIDCYEWFTKDNDIPLKNVYDRYKSWVEENGVVYVLSKRDFKKDLSVYFADFLDHTGNLWNVFRGFKTDFVAIKEVKEELMDEDVWVDLKECPSILDIEWKDNKAQYSNNDGSPRKKWADVDTKLVDLNSSNEHYVLVNDEQHIVIDFDLKDENGEKSLIKNIKAAGAFPPTYAECSKSGNGLHLHYIYDGDVDLLSRIYDEGIEVKVFKGNAACRRRLTLCNDIPIATINGGLPLRQNRSGDMISEMTIKSEKKLREMIERNLRMEIHENHASSVQFIHKLLKDAYESGMHYDVRDLREAVQSLAMNSSHQALQCMKLVSNMEFCSKDISEAKDSDYADDAPIVFFDCEVFPNLFVVVAKERGDKDYMTFVNPDIASLERLCKNRLIGFNCRKYDNHILYGAMMGYTNREIYELSQRIINSDGTAFFGEAYNLSYTDIYDFFSPPHKMSLKKWEIKLGIHHMELGLPWEDDVPEDMWEKVVEYCIYDVAATEAVFENKDVQADWETRKILSKLAGMNVNTPTNTLAARIILGGDKDVQHKFVYSDLSETFPGYKFDKYGIPKEEYDEGAKIVQGKSIFMGEDPSEGGYVYAEEGVYEWVVVLDIASMHPTSIIELNLFGEYTKNFKDIVDARIKIKHGEFDSVREMLDGKLAEFLDDESTADGLAGGLKGCINPVYGLTSAKFTNQLRDPRNEDNIVAKRGALFMILLKKKVQELGYKVVHIKTDSIKIARADPGIIDFVRDLGMEYGYTFEHESTYEKMCLVNDSNYVAKYLDAEACRKYYGYIPKNNGEESGKWTTTGDRFAHPYVFKTLFSGEEVVPETDFVETFSVTTSLWLDMNERLPDVSAYEKERDKLEDGIKKGKWTHDDVSNKIDELADKIRVGHDYHFVGKVGAFTPVAPGFDGGILLRLGNNGKYGAANGTKKKNVKGGVYRFLETEMVRKLDLFDHVDLSYYENMADESVAFVNRYLDFCEFLTYSVNPNENGFLGIPEKLGEDKEFYDYMNEPLPFK